jgi:hypothetical protein
MPWATCDVTQAGPAENGTIYIALHATDNSFHNWFVAVPQMEREMLATALTAVSTGKRVTTFVTDTAAYSTINRLYVIA